MFLLKLGFFDNFAELPLDPFQQVHVFSVLRSPELDTGLHSWIVYSSWGFIRAD